jgi:hypothetical protein
MADLTAALDEAEAENRKLREQIAAQSALLQHWMIQRAEAEIRAARKNKEMPNVLADRPAALHAAGPESEANEVERRVRAPGTTEADMTAVQLTAKTHKAKNRLIEAAKALPETWDFTWLVADERNTIQAKEGLGPWLLLVPAGVPIERGHDFSRWVHKTSDRDFEVHALYALGEGRERGILREASSGEAATSTDGLEG